MRKSTMFIAMLLMLCMLVGSVTAQDDLCNIDLEIMTTDDGVEFVRTPDACFENLIDWDYEPLYVEIDGLRQAYVDVGSGETGETILLLHGEPTWSYLYRKMIPVLAEAGHRVIAMDHLGMGRSDKPIDTDYYTFLGHTDRLETFIQELELEQGNLTIFSQDWGHVIGMYVVGTNPDWFTRVVAGNGNLPQFPLGIVPISLPEDVEANNESYHASLLATPDQQPIYYDEDGNLLVEQYGGSDYGWAAWMTYALTYDDLDIGMFVEAHTYFPISDDEEAAYNAPFPSEITMASARVFPSLVFELGDVTGDAWRGLRDYEKPFLTIWGGNDPNNAGLPRSQNQYIDRVPGAEGWDHVRLPEAGHYLQDDQGEEIARRINEFIAQTPVESELTLLGYRAGLYQSDFPTERKNLNGTHELQDIGFPRDITIDDVVVETIDMPYPALLYTRAPEELFIMGGMPFGIDRYVSLMDGLPAGQNETAPYLAKYNTLTGELININLDQGTTIPYLGGALMHINGYIYAVSQSYLYKIEPASMTIEASVELPATSPATVYNGLLTSSTGELILKSLSFMGGESEILLVDPDTLETTFTTSCACASPRLSLALDENGVEHMYHLNREKTFRYIVESGSLTLDPNWIASFDPDGTGINQEPTSPVIVDGRVYYTTNTNIDAELPMRVFWQDVNAVYTPEMPPLTGPLIFEGVEGAGWSFSGIAADEASGIFTGVDQANGLINAFRPLENGEIEVLWQHEQIIGSGVNIVSDRGMVYANDYVDGFLHLVVRDLVTGQELLRVPTPATRASIGSIVLTENGDVYMAANEPGQSTGLLIHIYIP
jgi:haloalkane dehalogenase